MNEPAPSVLIIEDEQKIRRFIRAGFEIHGYAVGEAENAGEGIRSAVLKPPDLVILDLALPDQDVLAP